MKFRVNSQKPFQPKNAPRTICFRTFSPLFTLGPSVVQQLPHYFSTELNLCALTYLCVFVFELFHASCLFPLCDPVRCNKTPTVAANAWKPRNYVKICKPFRPSPSHRSFIYFIFLEFCFLCFLFLFLRFPARIALTKGAGQKLLNDLNNGL